MANKSSVKSFLQELHQSIKIWGIFFVNRDKNAIQELADLGITAKMREEIVLQLTIEDYAQGPLPETQYGGKEMWVFGKIVKDQEIYIKLTIIEKTGGAVCISFHKSEHPLEYPLREQTDQ